MVWTAFWCSSTWLISFLLWKFGIDGVAPVHPPELEAARVLGIYFILNAGFDYFAYRMIGTSRIRFHTKPLRVILLLSMLCHVLGGIAYATGMAYEHAYMMALLAVAIAQVLAFLGPWANQHVGFHSRLRRHMANAAGNGRTSVHWTDRD
jgi:hypothetical protein